MVEVMIALIGGILVLLSVGGGYLTGTRSTAARQNAATFDRMFAGLIGISLIGASIGLRGESTALVHWGAAFAGGFTVVYSAALGQGDRPGPRRRR